MSTPPMSTPPPTGGGATSVSGSVARGGGGGMADGAGGMKGKALAGGAKALKEKGSGSSASDKAKKGEAAGGHKDAPVKQAAATGVTAAAGIGAMTLLAWAVLMNWLKMMLATMMAAIANLWSVLWGMFLAGVRYVVGKGVAAAAWTVGKVQAGASTVASAGKATVSVVTGGALTAAATVGSVFADSNDSVQGFAARTDQLVDECTVNVNTALADFEGLDPEVISANEMANAKRIHAVLAGLGMSDTNVAGILGNWSVESKVDPTAVETVYDEMHQMGPRKLKAQSVGFKLEKFNPEYKKMFPRIDLMGIGLGQWTNGRNTMLLNYADAQGAAWYDLNTQLSFMFTADDPMRVQVMLDMLSEERANPAEATRHFLEKWEGGDPSIPAVHFDRRVAAAEQWSTTIAAEGWEGDEDLATSLIDLNIVRGGPVIDTVREGVQAAYANCRTVNLPQGDNSSMAAAAVSYAHPNKELSRNNPGTPLFQFLHDAIFPGDTRYMSCDRSVAVAVRWSGSDDEYPYGPVRDQLQYLTIESAKEDGQWQELEFPSDPEKMSLEEFKTYLQPGDILIRNRTGSTGGGTKKEPSHVLMYVGTEVIQAMHPNTPEVDPTSDMMEGVFEERSPGLSKLYDTKYTTYNTGHQTYRVFRNVKKEEASKYVDMAIPESMVPREFDPDSLKDDPGADEDAA